MPGMAGPDALRAFSLPRFKDYLALEVGSSRHTVDNYLRDLRRTAYVDLRV